MSRVNSAHFCFYRYQCFQALEPELLYDNVFPLTIKVVFYHFDAQTMYYHLKSP